MNQFQPIQESSDTASPYGDGKVRVQVSKVLTKDEFAVHTKLVKPDGTFVLVQGDYTPGLKDAAISYEERCLALGCTPYPQKTIGPWLQIVMGGKG